MKKLKDFVLAAEGKAAGLYVDTREDSKTYTGIAHALENLQGDILAVTGIEPALKKDIAYLSSVVLIAGKIGESPFIDKLITDGKLDVSAI